MNKTILFSNPMNKTHMKYKVTVFLITGFPVLTKPAVFQYAPYIALDKVLLECHTKVTKICTPAAVFMELHSILINDFGI